MIIINNEADKGYLCSVSPRDPPWDSDWRDQCYQSCSKCINFPLWDQLCKLLENDIGLARSSNHFPPSIFRGALSIDLVDKLVWNAFTTFLLNPHYPSVRDYYSFLHSHLYDLAASQQQDSANTLQCPTGKTYCNLFCIQLQKPELLHPKFVLACLPTPQR